MTSLAQYPGPVEAVAAVRELNFQYLEAVRANDVDGSASSWARTPW